MSAGISYMYKASGGCCINERCMTCDYLRSMEETSGFGKAKGRAETYSCMKHEDTESGANWKPEYTACKFYIKAGTQTVFREEESSGQYSFMSLY